MSGPFGAGALQFFGAASSFYDYNINQSLRFPQPTGGGYLSRTFGSNGGDWTWSGWVKRSTIGAAEFLFASSSTSNPYVTAGIYFGSGDKLSYFQFSNAVGYTVNLESTALFRDVSAWYHVVATYDEDGNIVLYVNGTQVASGSVSATYRTINKTTYPHYIGNRTYQSNPGGDFHGYMAEIHFVDGSLLAPSNFAETKTGIWVPKEYTGSHGTNGFYLPFDDSSAIGDDESANTNDFSVTSLQATDVVLDSPTNNFAVIADDKGGTSQDYTEGNLHANQDGSGAGSYAAKSTMLMPMDSGKWYVEALSDATTASGAGLGTYTADTMNRVGTASYYYTGNIVVANDVIHYYSSGSIYQNGQQQSGLATVGDKDIIGMLVDTDAKTVQFYVNGSSQGTAVTMNNQTDPVGAQLHGHNTRPFMFNFGQDSSFGNRKTSGSANAQDAKGIGDFYYAPPAGAKAFCTANLPDPEVDPALDEEPADYFDTQLWTGTGSGQSFSNFTFQPDWLWFKNRNGTSDHAIFDSVRGVDAGLTSHSTSVENTAASGSQDLVSFDNDGFTTGTPFQYGSLGSNTLTIVTWAWRGGGSASSNSAGDITSSVSANTESGFSIVGYTGDGTSATRTIGCGLTKKPEAVILKNRTEDSVSDTWFVWHTAFGTASPSKYMTLYNTDAVAASGVFVDGSFSDNSGNALFAVDGSYNGVNKSSTTYIAYCFHSVEGYSKFGSYTGNGSSDGVFVYTGFRPAWIMTKRTDSTSSWLIVDNNRNTFNVVNSYLIPNGSNAEATATISDFTSNGFKLRGGTHNESGGSFIYFAFAEQPFKYSNAR